MIYNRLLRRILLEISEYVFEDRILEYLYPDDCLISFGDSDCLDGTKTEEK